MAGARRYAAEVTEQSQRGAAHGGRNTPDVDRSQQRPWNRTSLAETSGGGRHQRASDPVGWSLLNLASADLPSSSSASSSVWENSSYMSDLQRRRRRQLRIATIGRSSETTAADQAEWDQRLSRQQQRWQRRTADLLRLRGELAGLSGSGADQTESIPSSYLSEHERRLRRRIAEMRDELAGLSGSNSEGRAEPAESPPPSYMLRQRIRQPRAAASSWSNDAGADRAESPPPSWQTHSLHGTQLSANVQPSSSSRRQAATDNNQPVSTGLRPTLAGPLFHETSSLADVDLWPSSRRERDAASFAPVFIDDIENDAEEITSTGAEAGSTASIGGDTESMDADSDVRSADLEVGSVGAEVMVSASSGSGAEIGVIDPPLVRGNPYEFSDYGPSTSDLAVVPNSRNPSNYVSSRVSERLAEHVDLRDRTPQRRWRRFNQADLQDRASHGPPSFSAAASNGSVRISDWLEFEWAGDFVPRRLPAPQGRDYPEFSGRDRVDTSAASDVPLLRGDYLLARGRRGRPPPYSGNGAASNAALPHHPHECPPNCEICGGGRARNMRRMRTNQYLSELARDRFPDSGNTRTRPPPLSYETLAPAASAVDDDESMVGTLAQLRQEIETTRGAVPAYQWRESSASSVDAGRPPSFDSGRYPAAADFERHIRRVDERMSQMRRSMSVLADQAERDGINLRRYRQRERQTEAQRSQYRSDNLPSYGRTYDDELVPSASSIVTGYGSTGAEAVSEFVNIGQ